MPVKDQSTLRMFYYVQTSLLFVFRYSLIFNSISSRYYTVRIKENWKKEVHWAEQQMIRGMRGMLEKRHVMTCLQPLYNGKNCVSVWSYITVLYMSLYICSLQDLPECLLLCYKFWWSIVTINNNMLRHLALVK